MNMRRGVRRSRKPAILTLFLLAWGSFLLHAQNLPPKPDRYFTDNASVVNPATASALNDQLEQFERDTSNQILVAIYPNLPPEAEIAQYATDTYNAWKPGVKGKDNGAILFVFVQDHKLFISTGRGLEGALPDAICKRIITQLIVPQFKRGSYSDGIQAGVNAMLAAAKGEYVGNNSTQADQTDQDSKGLPPWAAILLVIFIIVASIIFRRSGGSGGPFIYTGGGWGGGGGFGGGNSGFGGGGGFSGGGGSSAGGGAGGSW